MDNFDHHTFPSVIKIIIDNLDILIQIDLVYMLFWLQRYRKFTSFSLKTNK